MPEWFVHVFHSFGCFPGVCINEAPTIVCMLVCFSVMKRILSGQALFSKKFGAYIPCITLSRVLM